MGSRLLNGSPQLSVRVTLLSLILIVLSGITTSGTIAGAILGVIVGVTVAVIDVVVSTAEVVEYNALVYDEVV